MDSYIFILVEKTSNWSVLFMYVIFSAFSGLFWYFARNSRYEKRVWFGVGSFAIISTLFTIGVKPTLFLMGFFQVCAGHFCKFYFYFLGCNKMCLFS